PARVMDCGGKAAAATPLSLATEVSHASQPRRFAIINRPSHIEKVAGRPYAGWPYASTLIFAFSLAFLQISITRKSG
ncbi:MAG: hypothetical protein P4N60_00700, partial [Verrucomicrobiae bacterium]|nr:hypothetical protein [Verrucomicrobiae bacterium]